VIVAVMVGLESAIGGAACYATGGGDRWVRAFSAVQ
jgi:hypothetical protein